VIPQKATVGAGVTWALLCGSTWTYSSDPQSLGFAFLLVQVSALVAAAIALAGVTHGCNGWPAATFAACLAGAYSVTPFGDFSLSAAFRVLLPLAFWSIEDRRPIPRILFIYWPVVALPASFVASWSTDMISMLLLVVIMVRRLSAEVKAHPVLLGMTALAIAGCAPLAYSSGLRFFVGLVFAVLVVYPLAVASASVCSTEA
jgi:hypothetical protein